MGFAHFFVDRCDQALQKLLSRWPQGLATAADCTDQGTAYWLAQRQGTQIFALGAYLNQRPGKHAEHVGLTQQAENGVRKRTAFLRP